MHLATDTTKRIASLGLAAAITAGTAIAGFAFLEAQPATSASSHDDLTHPNRSAYAATLERVVTDRGFVEYAALKADHADLTRYVDSLADADVWKMQGDEQLAVLINAYNAFTLTLITEYYPNSSERAEGKTLESIRDIPEAQRWKHDRWELGGRTVSLDELEHEIIRVEFDEPRIHWALVCAAASCPPLRAEPYNAESLDEQLRDQGQTFHNREDAYRFDADRNTVHLTQLYNWFGEDFGSDTRERLLFASRYDADLALRIARGKMPSVAFLDYDWSLNDQRAEGDATSAEPSGG